MTSQPIFVCWGMGQDSTGMWERGNRPDLIIIVAGGGR